MAPIIVLLLSAAYAPLSFMKDVPPFSAMRDVNEYLESAAVPIYSVPISILDFCGSVFCCKRYRESILSNRPKYWLETLLACTILQFGGTTITGLLLGQVPSWILSHSASPALFLSWWLTFCCPMDLYYRYIIKGSIGVVFLFVLGIGSAISAGHAVTSWGMDKALWNVYHINSPRIGKNGS